MSRWKSEARLALFALSLLLAPGVWAASGSEADGAQVPAPQAEQAPVTKPVAAKPVATPSDQPDTRETIVYLGMGSADGVSVTPALRAVVERELLVVLKTDRFQVFALAGAEPLSMDDFTDQLEALAADPPPEPRPAWAKDLERISAAVYFCELYLTRFDVSLDEVRAGQKTVVSVSAVLDVFRLDLSDPKRPIPSHVTRVGKVMPVTQTGMLREQGLLDAQLRPLVKRASKALAGYLTLQLRQQPEFELQAKLLKAEGDAVFLPMGKDLGIQLNDAFIIRKRSPDGQTHDVAYAKVREVMPDTSRAQLITTYGDWTFGGDEIAARDEQQGIGLGVAAVLEYTGLDLFGNGGPGFYPGIALTLTSDLSTSTQWADFHLAVDLDYLAVGKATAEATGTIVEVHLGHATIGLQKKWTFDRLALSAGVRAGFAFYIYPEGGVVDEGPTAHLGFGADAVFGTEVFLAPYATLGLKLVGRYFSNPVDWVGVPYDEIALRIEAGVLFTF